ncbi:MAG: hypothetical protein ABSA71_06930 [Desulfomonilia bacterium]|jgi:hypothetical protein
MRDSKEKRFITVKHTRIIEEHTKGIFHHEEHEEHEGKNTLEISDRGNEFNNVRSAFLGFSSCSSW